MSQIEAVFFDCDGTLVDSEVICSRAYVTMFQEFGITLDPEEVFKRFQGVKLYEIIDIVSLEHGVTLAKTEAEHVYRAEVARLFDSELEAIEGAKVETVQDANNLQAIKVTFDNGILFATNKSELSPASREALIKFANSLKNSPDTDVTIYGHTDNTGSRAVNERADAVANYLVSQGISRSRMTTEGLAFDQPVADNSTASGRAQNRRVEVYITANADMIRKAQNGQLN